MINRSYYFKMKRYLNGEFRGASWKVRNIKSFLPPDLVPHIEDILEELGATFPDEDISFEDVKQI